jgi:hypothetical protein
VKTAPLAAVWKLILLAFALRAAWILYRWFGQGATLEYPDEELHWQLARNLVSSGTLVTDDGRFAARMPLYPLFLALFAGLGPVGMLAAKLGQALLGAATVGVAHFLVRAALGPRAAVVAGLLMACDPFGIFFANLLLSEGLFTLLLVTLVASVWSCGAAAPRPGAWIGLAVLGPALILTRPSSAALVPVLWLLVAWWQWRGPGSHTPESMSRRRRVAASLLLSPALLILLSLPWGLRNKAVLGSYAWLSTNGGVTLYDAQGPLADGSSNQAFLHASPELAGLDEVALDRTLTHLAWQQMQRDPARVVRLAGTKFLRLWNPFPNVAEYRGGVAAWAGAAYTLVVLLGAVGGAVLVLTKRDHASLRRLHGLLWVPVIYFTLLHCVYIGSVRYRVPLMPLLAVGAASAARSSTPRIPAADQSGFN